MGREDEASSQLLSACCWLPRSHSSPYRLWVRSDPRWGMNSHLDPKVRSDLGGIYQNSSPTVPQVEQKGAPLRGAF